MLPTRLSDYQAVRLAIRSRFIHMATSLMVNDIWDFSETYKDIYTYVHVETYLMHFKMKSYPHFYLYFGKIWWINIGLRSIDMQLKIRILQDFFFMLTNMHLIYVNTARSDVLHVDNISCPEGGGDRNMHQLCLLKYK